MPLAPLTVTLSEGQQRDALKRLHKSYADELAQVEATLTEVLTSLAEAEYLSRFLGEQPEVKALRNRAGEVETLEARRQYLGKLLDRIAQVTPAQPDVKAPLPSGGPEKSRPANAGGAIRRY